MQQFKYFSSIFQRAQPEIVTFLGYESDNALYSIPGKKLDLNIKAYYDCVHVLVT